MQKKQELFCQCWLSLLVLTFPQLAGAQESCEPIAQIVSAQGEIRINQITIDNASASRERKDVCAGDLISVGELSRAAIAILNTDVVVRIDQNTELRLHASPIKDPSFLELLKGAINILSPAPQELEIRTAYVNAAVEGTEFHIRVEDDHAVVTVLEGKVRASNDKGTVSLTSDQSARAQLGKAPKIDITIIPSDAVQWALYYAPVLDYATAIEGLTEVDPRFHTRQAAQALSVGAVYQAKKSIEAALDLDAENAEAWALQLIIAITQNNEGSIVSALKESEKQDLTSAAALIALSYAQQSQFKLSDALDSLQKAVVNNPDNALARARLAELWLSLGHIDKALDEARKADSQAKNARSKTVLGFAYLAQIRVSDAAEAFLQAIELGSEDPLPHLGLGLAKIRSGDLSEGRRDIEIAADLDRNNALIRSYLGKAFYEEKRGKLSDEECQQLAKAECRPLDEEQFRIAKELDDKDPTPWFYDAIRKQTVNQPIAALDDLQKSIARNDNRAVYRSSLKLDEDMAARSASLGRIYRDLGFEQRALVEGWRSVNADPSDYSGHRFLADTYSILPRHGIARVSELLQSQLLQPINLTPIQPQLAETNLFVLSGAGPSDIAFNEFNPLFTRDRVGVQFNGVGGDNSTAGNDFVFSGISGRFSYSIGQFHYETDGFRINNDQDRDIYNAFFQAAVTPKTSIQFEHRSTQAETGDLNLLFVSSVFSPARRLQEDFNTSRIGLHHTFTPNSEVIASVQHGDSDDDFFEEFGIPGVFSGTLEIFSESESWIVEAQHLFRTENFKIISGVGHFTTDRQDVNILNTEFPFPPFSDTTTTVTDDDSDQTNLYAYSLIDLTDDLTLTLGISADLLDGELFDRDQVNPKLGVTWRPTSGTTVRAAAFRTLQRALVSDQTIEPTQVAGFNQFFDDNEGDEAWRYGLAVDRQFSRDLYTGIEVSRRDLKVVLATIFPAPTPPIVARVDRKEDVGRAYLYWTPTARVAFSGEYLFERFDRDSVDEDTIIKLTTHRFPLSFAYFSPSGWTLKFRGTYLDQDGSFQAGLVQVEGDDQFWVADASIGYRLPKRRGIVSLEAKNVLDEQFQFQDTDPKSPIVQPERIVLLRVSLSF